MNKEAFDQSYEKYVATNELTEKLHPKRVISPAEILYDKIEEKKTRKGSITRQ